MYFTTGDPIPLHPERSTDGANYEELEAKDPSSLTDAERFALNGKPRLGDITKTQVQLYIFQNLLERGFK